MIYEKPMHEKLLHGPNVNVWAFTHCKVMFISIPRVKIHSRTLLYAVRRFHTFSGQAFFSRTISPQKKNGQEWTDGSQSAANAKNEPPKNGSEKQREIKCDAMRVLR